MLGTAASDGSTESDVSSLPITVVSERPFTRDLVVDFLRRHGFPQTAGRATFRQLPLATGRETRSLVFVDLENDKADARQLLRELRAHRGITTVAMGTPMQLAANGEDADGWIDVSEPASRLTDMAASASRTGRHASRRRGSPEAEGWSRTWRTLSTRQRQVLALLGCGLDNQKLAGALGVSERAAKAHVSTLLDRFKADSRTELALIACQANLHAPLPGVRRRA